QRYGQYSLYSHPLLEKSLPPSSLPAHPHTKFCFFLSQIPYCLLPAKLWWFVDIILHFFHPEKVLYRTLFMTMTVRKLYRLSFQLRIPLYDSFGRQTVNTLHLPGVLSTLILPLHKSKTCQDKQIR